MLELFSFPMSMAAGGLLVTSPIIIHLINRMRFKRVRWAAMEFLLKSQKRNRRKLIIEQLLLLLLRILLVILAALIVARFVGFAFAFFTPQNRHHIVILDDTPSSGDRWAEEGETRSSFKTAKKVINEEIAKNAAIASKAQTMKLLLASRPDEVLFNQRLTDATRRDLEGVLTSIEKESPQHVDLLQSIKKARKLFEDTPQEQRILYIVSDFRATDWNEPNGRVLLNELSEMAKLGVFVKFVDVSHPTRKDGEAEPRYHDNLAIVRLTPETKVLGEDLPANFTVVVANHSPSDVKNVQVRVKLNGQDRAGSSVPLQTVPAGGQVEAKFTVYPNELGPNLVSAYIEPDIEKDTGLALDNTRYAVIEVRKRVPLLMIDGDNTRETGGDRYFMEKLFGDEKRRGLPGFQADIQGVARLEEADLSQYPSIYLVNVRELSDKALTNLENYVKEGGSVFFFLGDRVNPDFYNKKLYADGTGLFPAPLSERPSPDLTKEERQERSDVRLTNDAPYYLIVRDEKHPAFRELLDEADPTHFHPFYQVTFRYDVDVNKHYPVARAKWSPQAGKVEELASLPNTKSADDFKDNIQKLLARLPLEDPKFKVYANGLTSHRNAIRDLLANKQPLYKVATALDRFLQDGGDTRDADKRPNLKEFWALADNAGLKSDFEKTLAAVKFGDPLLIEGRYGKGRVLVCTTTLGNKWNNLAAEQFYPVFMGSLQRYLTSVNQDADMIVGQPLEITLDQNRFDTKMRRFRKTEGGEAGPGGKVAAPGEIDMGEQQQTGTPTNGRIRFVFSDAKEPGMYLMELYPSSNAPTGSKPERRAFAYNIDSNAESNLLRYRISREDLEKSVPNSRFYALGADKFTDLADRKSDLSESPWLFLAFLLVLVLEQALAVHLSFHLRGGSAAPPARAMPA